MPGELCEEWSGKWPGHREAQVLGARGWREWSSLDSRREWTRCSLPFAENSRFQGRSVVSVSALLGS